MVPLSTDLWTLLKSGELSDFTIICNEKKLQTHRVILSARSPRFLELFMGEWKNLCEVKVNHSGRIMQLILELVYTNEILTLAPLSSEEGVELLAVTQQYIPDLLEAMLQSVGRVYSHRLPSLLPTHMATILKTEQPLFSDCAFSVENTIIRAHKAILCARSPYFR